MNNDTSNSPILSIRKGNMEDLPEMLHLFQDTITTICKNDYTQEQLEVWSSGARNEARWLEVMRNQFVLVAQFNQQIAGFCTLDGEHIDLLFVHKDHQHQGIASQLYDLIEKKAIQQHKKRLTADVSKTARLFFEKVGFLVIQEQTVNVKGIDLNNYKMEKILFT